MSFKDYNGFEWPDKSVLGTNGKSAEWKMVDGELVCSDRMYKSYITTEWFKTTKNLKRNKDRVHD